MATAECAAYSVVQARAPDRSAYLASLLLPPVKSSRSGLRTSLALPAARRICRTRGQPSISLLPRWVPVMLWGGVMAVAQLGCCIDRHHKRPRRAGHRVHAQFVTTARQRSGPSQTAWTWAGQPARLSTTGTLCTAARDRVCCGRRGVLIKTRRVSDPVCHDGGHLAPVCSNKVTLSPTIGHGRAATTGGSAARVPEHVHGRPSCVHAWIPPQ